MMLRYLLLLLFLSTFIGTNSEAGRFDNAEQEKIEKTIIGFLRNTPPEKLKWNWEEAIGLHGLAVLVPHLSQKLREESFDFIKRYQYFWDKKQPEISWADECPSVLSSFILGDDYLDKSSTNFWRVYDYLKDPSLNDIGSIDHLGNKSFITKIFRPYRNSIWLDSVMMWGNFSLRAGIKYDDQDLVELALSQPIIFSRYLQDEETGMFIHSYNYRYEHTYPRKKLFWTRGNGWMAVTLADFLELMNRSDERYERLKEIFSNLMEGYLEVSKKSNLWRNLYPRNRDNRVDTSGSALIAYAMIKGARIGVLDKKYAEQGIKTFGSINNLLKKTKHGLRMSKVIGPTVPGPRIFYRIIPYQRKSFFGYGSYFLLASEIFKYKN